MMEAVFRMALLALFTCATTAAAQETIVIEGGPAGTACPVAEELIGSIEGGPDAPIGGTDLGRLALDLDGAIWVAPRMVPGLILRYGLQGDAPELRVDLRTPGGGNRPIMINQLAWSPGHGLHVFGAPNAHLLLSGNGEIRNRAFHPSTGSIGSAAILPDGRYILNGPVRNRSVHIVEDDGEIVRSLSDAGSTGLTGELAYIRFVALTHDSTAVWTAARDRYRVTLWNLEGERERTLQRDVEWFQPWTEWVSPTEGPPPPRLLGLATDSSGRLWTKVLVADPEFEPLPPPDPDLFFPPDPEESRQYDAVIEVLDPESGAVLAHCRFPGHVGLLPGPYLVRPSLTSTGAQRFRIFRVELDPDG